MDNITWVPDYIKNTLGYKFLTNHPSKIELSNQETDELQLLDKDLQNQIIELEKSQAAFEIFNKDLKLKWVSSELKYLLNQNNQKILGYNKSIIECMSYPVYQNILSQNSQIKFLVHTINNLSQWVDETVLIKESKQFFNYDVIKQFKKEAKKDIWTCELEFIQNYLPPAEITCFHIVLQDDKGNFSGLVRLYYPALKASILSLVARGNKDMFERMANLFEPGNRKSAILFADLENSSELAKKLPTSVYFNLISNLTRNFDDIVIANNGIVGKHAGDGASAYFIANSLDDVSTTSLKAINTAFALQENLKYISDKINKELNKELNLKLNIGIHWGGTLYMGQIVTGGRLEVTAIGEEVNACSRFEQIAKHGAIIASKDLVERLSPQDALDIDLELNKINYIPINELKDLDNKIKKELGSLSITYL